MNNMEEYKGLDAFNIEHLNIEVEDIHLLIISSLKYFIDSDNIDLIKDYIELIERLMPYIGNYTILEMFNILKESNHLNIWKELIEKLEETYIVKCNGEIANE